MSGGFHSYMWWMLRQNISFVVAESVVREIGPSEIAWCCGRRKRANFTAYSGVFYAPFRVRCLGAEKATISMVVVIIKWWSLSSLHTAAIPWFEARGTFCANLNFTQLSCPRPSQLPTQLPNTLHPFSNSSPSMWALGLVVTIHSFIQGIDSTDIILNEN